MDIQTIYGLKNNHTDNNGYKTFFVQEGGKYFQASQSKGTFAKWKKKNTLGEGQGQG